MGSYDPKLKEAARRIEAICEEYDCGGFVSLVSKSHGEFRFMLPKWGAIFEEVDSQGNVMVRLKTVNMKNDPAMFERAELTAHFIHSLQDTAAACFSLMDEFIKVTKEKWKTEHKPFAGFRPHKDEH